MMGTKLPREIQSKSEWEAVGLYFWESKEFENYTNEQTLTCIWIAREILALDEPQGEFMVISVMPDFHHVSLKPLWWNSGRGMSCPVCI